MLHIVYFLHIYYFQYVAFKVQMLEDNIKHSMKILKYCPVIKNVSL